jgi:phenylacetate-CoA ligase
MRIRGWLGRADQTTKVRGMFVHPQQIHDVLARHPELGRARLEVRADGAQDAMTLRCETSDGAVDLAQRVAETVRALTGLRADIELVAAGSLPSDGKVIDDRRATP